MVLSLDTGPARRHATREVCPPLRPERSPPPTARSCPAHLPLVFILIYSEEPFLSFPASAEIEPVRSSMTPGGRRLRHRSKTALLGPEPTVPEGGRSVYEGFWGHEPEPPRHALTGAPIDSAPLLPETRHFQFSVLLAVAFVLSAVAFSIMGTLFDERVSGGRYMSIHVLCVCDSVIVCECDGVRCVCVCVCGGGDSVGDSV